jgi:hypothetical protein
VIERLRIDPYDIANMDETGLGLGRGTNSKVVGSSATNSSYRKSPEDREWVSIIECITASGTLLQPLVIFQGKNV